MRDTKQTVTSRNLSVCSGDIWLENCRFSLLLELVFTTSVTVIAAMYSYVRDVKVGVRVGHLLHTKRISVNVTVDM